MHYLGRTIRHHGSSISLWVGDNYTQHMLNELNLDGAKSPKTTGSHQIEPHDACHSKDEDSYDQHNYRRNVGKLQWLTGCRPDIQYAVKELARDSNNARPSSWKKVKHLIKYLKGTSQHRLVFRHVTSAQKLTEIDVTSDAGRAGCPESRRSTSGYCVQNMGKTHSLS